jgi:hypothetical protein
MSIQLPPPIALYVQLENAGDTATLSTCFAPNAIVRDESRTYEGLAAITAWKAETTQKYQQFPLSLQAQSSLGQLPWPFVNIDAKIAPDLNAVIFS